MTGEYAEAQDITTAGTHQVPNMLWVWRVSLRGRQLHDALRRPEATLALDATSMLFCMASCFLLLLS